MSTLPSTLPLPTRIEASRFLSHAAIGYTSADIDALRAVGYEAWLTRQYAAWRQTSHWDWMLPRYAPASSIFAGDLGTSVWRRFIEGRDVLRQKVTFALSEILVTSVRSFLAGYTEYGGAAYLDMLEERAFGNFRDILQGISESLFMAYYLTFKGSRKADGQGTQQPDENYARELLQLFSIGLFVLDEVGNPVPDGDGFKQAYTQADVEALARVFTGWDADIPDWPGAYQRWRRPMINSAVYFDSGFKSFSFAPGITIPAGATPQDNLRIALDAIFQHPNVGLFIGKQLIQKLVTSNPSPGYVRRVASAFNDNGQGVRGDMKAVIRAILLDEDLFNDTWRRIGKGPNPDAFGKLREPAARLVHFARAFNMKSRSGNWRTPTFEVWQSFRGVGQEPMKSPSVFNFYRPDYSPPGTDFSASGSTRLYGPEFQITTESSVVSYVTAMSVIVDWTVSNKDAAKLDALVDYSPWLTKASDPASLVYELNVLLAAGHLSDTTTQLIVNALNTMPMVTTVDREKRVKAAALMVVASPEFIVQK